MPIRRIRVPDAPAILAGGLGQLAIDLEIPGPFGPEVLAEAREVARSGPIDHLERADLTRLPFVTIDPVGATDLDQAVFIERGGSGFRVWYAIADVGAWVRPGGAIDSAAQQRGQTYYAPTWRVPLHPPVLSEDAASLLADGTARPALTWRIELDADGVVRDVEVQRAWVRSRAQLSYAGVQAELDAGSASEALQLLRTVGLLRQQVEIDRGGVSLNLPEQEVVTGNGSWHLRFRRALPVEGWNAQVSLLTGISAANLMIEAGVGVLRTLPPARKHDVEVLRRVAKSLGLAWPATLGYPEFVRSLDPADPDGQAMLNACTTLFRGAGYTVIDPFQQGQLAVHAALSTPYAHATAPLRRLVDRYVGALCVEVSAGRPAPQWVLAGLAELPVQMAQSDQRAKRFERGIIDRVEALILQGREGDRFEGTIIDLDDRGRARGVASIPRVAVEAPVEGPGLVLGEQRCLQVVSADPEQGRVLFAPA